MKQKLNFIIPVLLYKDIQRDLKWYQERAGFETIFSDSIYAGIFRNGLHAKKDSLLEDRC